MADGQMDEIRAMVGDKISQAGAAKMAALEDDEDDDFDEELPTKLASPELSALARAATEEHEAKLRDAESGRGSPAGGPPAPGAPPGAPAPLGGPKPAEAPGPLAMPEPMAKREEPSPPVVAPSPPAAAPSPPAAAQAARPGPAPMAVDPSPEDDGDLMDMLQKQKRKDMVMYAIAFILFAIGIAVLIINRFS